jgi:glutamate 5-kinase
VEGLLSAGAVLPTVERITPEIEQLAGGTDRLTSVGGMSSKIEAAKIVTRAGATMAIASGEHETILADLLAGQERGTLFVPRTPKLPGRKRWIAFFQRAAGVLTVDDGARTALCEQGKSLLAKGIKTVTGQFGPEALVSICSQNGVEFARGLTKVGSQEIAQTAAVVVHRDDLVIL